MNLTTMVSFRIGNNKNKTFEGEKKIMIYLKLKSVT